MTFPTCKVSGKILNPNGVPIGNGIIQAELSEAVRYQGYIVPHRLTTRSDANGEFSLDLWPNVLKAIPQTWYAIIIATGQEVITRFNIIVPNSPEANIFGLKTTDVPPATHDDIAKMLASLAEIEANVKADAAEVDKDTTDVDKKYTDIKALSDNFTAGSAQVTQDVQTANAAKTAAEIAASNAGTHEDNIKQYKEAMDATGQRIKVIYQQILDAVNKGGGEGAGIAHLVIHDAFVYRAQGGGNSVTGADVKGIVLSYTPGLTIVMRNGLVLAPAISYDDSSGNTITFTEALEADDIIIIMALARSAQDQAADQADEVSGNGVLPRDAFFAIDVNDKDRLLPQEEVRKMHNNTWVYYLPLEDSGDYYFKIHPKIIRNYDLLYEFTLVGKGGYATPNIDRRRGNNGGKGGDVIVFDHIRLKNPDFYAEDFLNILRIKSDKDSNSLRVQILNVENYDVEYISADPLKTFIHVYDANAPALLDKRLSEVPKDGFFYPGGAIAENTWGSGGTGGGGAGGLAGGESSPTSGGNGGNGFGSGGCGGGAPSKKDVRGFCGMSSLWEYITPEILRNLMPENPEDGGNGLFGGGAGGAGHKDGISLGKDGKPGQRLVIIKAFPVI